MNKLIQKKQGFTLIEILIATGIFSLLMAVTSGIVAQSSGYQAKIKALRTVSMETRKIADFVSSEVRSANALGSIRYRDDSNIPRSLSYSTSLALFSCSGGFCAPKYRLESDITGIADDANLDSNVLVTFVKREGIIYAHVLAHKDANEGKFYYAEVSLASGELDINEVYAENESSEGRVKSVSGESGVLVKFGGLAPAKDDLHHKHPYVTFSIKAKTQGYDSLSLTQRASASIRSMVDMRSY